MEELPLPPLKDGSVRIRMLAAPVNPADMNMIQGKVFMSALIAVLSSAVYHQIMD